MAGVQRRALLQRNEENPVVKSSKNIGTRHNIGARTALSNLSNIQRRPILGTKKDVGCLERNALQKPITRAKAQSNLQRNEQQNLKESKKEVFDIHIDNENHVKMDESLNAPDLHSLSLNEDLDVEDIDVDDLGNPSLCAEYVKDIYKYMHKLEKRLLPGDYLSHQSELNKKMRSILIDWLIQVQSRFNLLQETLFLTVYTIDRFLDKHDVGRSELQLVGVTAMLLASKYEEMYAPEIGDFVYITDNAYSKLKIRSMEQKMLRACEYDFSNPLCLHFLRRNSKAGSVDAQKHTLAKYIMELTLVDYAFVRRLPSIIAAAALYLSIKLIDFSEWSATLCHYSGYSEEELTPVVADMSALILSVDTSKYQAVKTKYSASKFLRISRLPELKGDLIKQYAQNATNKCGT